MGKKNKYHLSYELKREIIKLCDELTGLSARKMSAIVSQKLCQLTSSTLPSSAPKLSTSKFTADIF